MRTAKFFLATAALAATSPLAAQQGTIGSGASWEYYSFRDPAQVGVESISLLTIPAAVRFRVADPLVLSVSTVWARASLVRTDGTESTMEGPTDTELRAQYTVGRDLLTLTAVALLPTGAESLSFAEADVAGVIASDEFPFRISNWGSGGGVGMSAAVARSFGGFGAGISAGYVVAREFEPLLDDAFAYRPGSELKVRAVLDRSFGSAGKGALVLTLQHFDVDEVDGTNLFRAGRRYEAAGSYAFAFGSGGAGLLYLGYLRRETGEFLDEPDFLPAQDLIFTGAALELRTGSVLLRPVADVRVLRRDDGFGQGYTTSAGLDAELGAGSFTFVPRLRGRFGNVLLQVDAESGFTGVEAGLAIRFGRGTP